MLDIIAACLLLFVTILLVPLCIFLYKSKNIVLARLVSVITIAAFVYNVFFSYTNFLQKSNSQDAIVPVEDSPGSIHDVPVIGSSTNDSPIGNDLSKNSGDIIVGNNNNITKSEAPHSYEPPLDLSGYYSNEFAAFLSEKNQELRLVKDDTYAPSPEGTNGALFKYTLTNTTTHAIEICRFSFNAYNIKVNYDPVLHFYSVPSYTDSYKPREEIVDIIEEIGFDIFENQDGKSISVGCYNEGWGPAKNLNLEYFDSAETDHSSRKPYIVSKRDGMVLSTFFPQEKLNKQIETLEPGTNDVIYSLYIQDKSKYINKIYEEIPTFIRYSYDGLDKPIEEYIGSVYFNDEFIYYEEGGKGASNFWQYGLEVPLEQDNFTFTAEVDESIPAGETVTFQFFFFTQKSASMDFNVEFTTASSDIPKITSPDSSVNLVVSSVFPPAFKSAETIDEYDRIHGIPNSVIYFPFSTVEEFRENGY